MTNNDSIIDLRSDTVTQPTQLMREAMFKAEVGDDVYDEDPTVNELQNKMAQLTNKEKALFVTSGTMGNLISVLCQCNMSDEVIVGEKSHIAKYEQSGVSALGGVRIRTVKQHANGELDIESIKKAINVEDVHFGHTKLICLENTWHGVPLDLVYLREVKQIANQHHLKLHLDGARLFNAQLALNKSISELTNDFDTVTICFSKGMACPVGSVICASDEIIFKAKRLRKLLGGGMRQAGILASACLVALETMPQQIAQDHKLAEFLAQELNTLNYLKVIPEKNRTNMVFFDIAIDNLNNSDFIQGLSRHNVLFSTDGNIRAVTHYGINQSDITQTVSRIKNWHKNITSNN